MSFLCRGNYNSTYRHNLIYNNRWKGRTIKWRERCTATAPHCSPANKGRERSFPGTLSACQKYQEYPPKLPLPLQFLYVSGFPICPHYKFIADNTEPSVCVPYCRVSAFDRVSFVLLIIICKTIRCKFIFYSAAVLKWPA